MDLNFFNFLNELVFKSLGMDIRICFSFSNSTQSENKAMREWQKLYWSRKFACATHGGIRKCSRPLLQTFALLSPWLSFLPLIITVAYVFFLLFTASIRSHPPGPTLALPHFYDQPIMTTWTNPNLWSIFNIQKKISLKITFKFPFKHSANIQQRLAFAHTHGPLVQPS